MEKKRKFKKEETKLIKQKLIALELKEKDLAEELNMSTPFLSMVLHGKKNASEKLLKKLKELRIL